VNRELDLNNVAKKQINRAPYVGYNSYTRQISDACGASLFQTENFLGLVAPVNLKLLSAGASIPLRQ